MPSTIKPLHHSTVKLYNIIPDYIKDMERRFGKIGEGVKVVVDSASISSPIVNYNGTENIKIFVHYNN